MGNNINVDGHVSVGRDAAVGGNATVQGDMTVGHGLNVRGWLDAPNIKVTNKGVFSTEAKLKAAYPTPHEGWYAGVIVSTDVVLYIVNGGEWTSTSADYTGAFDAPEKADKVTVQSGTTEDYLAELDAEGNLKKCANKAEDFALKSEMSVTDGTGADADKATIQLRSGLSKQVLIAHQDVSGKADKVASATNGHLAALNENGNLVDAGCGIDNEPKALSSNLVRSGSVYTGLQNKANKVVHSSVSNSDNFVVKNLDGVLVYSDKTIEDLEDAMAGATSAEQSAEDALAAKNAAVDAKNDAVSAKTAAQNAKNDAVSAKNDAVSAKDDAVSAKNAAESAAATASATALRTSGMAVGEAVRIEYTFTESGKMTLCNDQNSLMVIEGEGSLEKTYNVEAASVGEPATVVASFVFSDPSAIPENAFGGINWVTSVHIPSYVHSIGDNAFDGCSKIESIDCEAMTPPTLGNDTFKDVDTNEVSPKVHSVVKTYYVNWGGFSTIDTY